MNERFCDCWQEYWSPHLIPRFLPLPATTCDNTSNTIPRGKGMFIVIGLRYLYVSSSSFCRYIQELGTKQQLMELMTHSDPDVRYNALMAVQQYMSNAWYILE